MRMRMTIRHSNPVEDDISSLLDPSEEELQEMEFHFIWSEIKDLGLINFIRFVVKLRIIFGVKLWLTSMLRKLRSKLVSQRST